MRSALTVNCFCIADFYYPNMAVATLTEYGGYEYKFVNPVPDRCLCNICHLPSRDAYMTGQCCRGLTICKSCLDQWQITAENMKCPASLS